MQLEVSIFRSFYICLGNNGIFHNMVLFLLSLNSYSLYIYRPRYCMRTRNFPDVAEIICCERNGVYHTLVVRGTVYTKVQRKAM